MLFLSYQKDNRFGQHIKTFYLQGTRSSVTTPLVLLTSVSKTVSLTAETWWIWSKFSSSLSWPWLRVMLPSAPMTASGVSFNPRFSKSTHDPSLLADTLKLMMRYWPQLTPLRMVSPPTVWLVPKVNSAQAGATPLQAHLKHRKLRRLRRLFIIIKV